MAVKRDPKDGFVTGTTLGGALDTFKYDTFGELTGYAAKYKVGLTITTLDAVAYTRDADGRITAKTETIGGKKTTYTYIYDQAGRLATVKQNGASLQLHLRHELKSLERDYVLGNRHRRLRCARPVAQLRQCDLHVHCEW